MFLAGPAIYIVEFRLKHLPFPWYVPALGTAGTVLMAVSIWRRRGVLRGIALLLFVAVCGFEWFMLLVALRTPVYTGPAQPGRQLPAFVTALADGARFTEKNLAEGMPTVLVFYRGRW